MFSLSNDNVTIGRLVMFQFVIEMVAIVKRELNGLNKKMKTPIGSGFLCIG